MFSRCRKLLSQKTFNLSGRKWFQPVQQYSFSTVAYDPSKIRNCAIIAHVDHGKTTLMDKLLTACGNAFDGERAMDSNVHEKERGITITSKYTRIHYNDNVLHVVDTPGHADFSGEVERILSMVDGVILLVDASEGPMSQTKFVLSKALAAGKKAIVVLNKVDREGHRAEEVQNEIFDLFCALTSDEEQLDYPLMFASSRQGWVVENLSEVPSNGSDAAHNGVIPLLNKIVSFFPPPCTQAKVEKPFAVSINTLNADFHLGRIVTGKVETGIAKIGDPIHVLSRDGSIACPTTKITKLFYLQGLQRVDVETAYAGQIVSIAGCNGNVADTVCAPNLLEPIQTLPITPPVISMTFGVNDSPLAGKEGSKLTSSLLRDRLVREVENNVTLTLRSSSADSESMDVQGRGELQIGILVETMRREGFEMTICPPTVLNVEIDGVLCEPIEEVVVDIDPDMQGLVIESMSNRRGNMIEFKDIGNRSRMTFEAPSRGLVGFRSEITNATRGNVTVNSAFSKYAPVQNDLFNLKKGKLVSTEHGKTTGYALMMIEERGALFVGVGEDCYEGLVIGENSRNETMDVNPCRMKKLTNIRTTGAEEQVRLTPPRRMTVEELISYMDEDEVLEVTPKSVRLRKKILDANERARVEKAEKMRSKAKA